MANPVALFYDGIMSFRDGNGNELSGGFVATYQAGTSTPAPTWADSLGVSPLQNPIPLNARGEPQNATGTSVGIWGPPQTAYKFVVTDSAGNLIRMIDNVIAPVGNLSQVLTQAIVGAALWPQTAQELAAGVTPTNFAYPPLDIRRYGGDPTGGVASDAALAAALAVVGATGGTIRFPGPNANYHFANQYSLSAVHGIVFQGDGGPTSSNTNGTVLTYTGTASPWWNCPQAAACSWRGMTLSHSNAGFTGTYIKFGANGSSPSNFCSLYDVAMGSVTSGVVHLDLDKTITFTATNCLFLTGGSVGSIKGQAAAGGSYSNVIKFRNCEWNNCAVNPIAFGGQTWTFDGCTFENLSNGTCGAFGSSATTPQDSLRFTGCWFGDATVGGGTWITHFGRGFSFDGNLIQGNSTSVAIALFTTDGAYISGNVIASFSAGVSFGDASCHAVVVIGNQFSGMTNIFGNTANTPANLVFNPNFCTNITSPLVPPSQIGANGAQGWITDQNGKITIWGTSTVTTSTPLALTFGSGGVSGIAFPTALWNVQATLVTPSNGANTLSVTSPGTTGFTLNVAGTAGSNSVHWVAFGI